MKRRAIFIASGIAAAFLCALLILAATGWFDNFARQRIVSSIEHATGGHASIRSARFDWRHLTAELDGLVIRNTSAGTAPFLSADRVRMQFRLASLFGRDVDLASLTVIHPQLALSSSRRIANVPRFPGLRIHSFRIVQGVFQADLKRIALDTSGQDLNATVSLDGRKYDIGVSARHLHIAPGGMRPFDANVDLAAQLESNHLSIRRLSLVSGENKVEAQGTVQSFTQPVANLSVHANAAQLNLTGQLHYDAQNAFTLTGKLSGRHLAWHFRGVPLNNVALDSDVALHGRDLRFSNATLCTSDGNLSGTATLKDFHDAAFDGTVKDARIREAALLLAGKPLNLDGAATGKIHLTGTQDHFLLSAAVRVSPLPGPTPVSGNIQITYKSPSGAISFGNSQISLPQTQAQFSGSPRGVLQLTLTTVGGAGFRLLGASAPAWLDHATVSFTGQIASTSIDPHLDGDFTVANLPGTIHGHALLSRSSAAFSGFSAADGLMHATGTAHIALDNWSIRPDSSFTLRTRFSGLDLAKISQQNGDQRKQFPRISSGIASGALNLSGSLANPLGTAEFSARRLVINGEHLDSAQIAAVLNPNIVQIRQARVTAGLASVTVSGAYAHNPGIWRDGMLRTKVDSNGFPIASVLPLRDIAADLQIHGTAAARLVNGAWEPTNADGALIFRNVDFHHVRLGSARIDAKTSGDAVMAKLSGTIRGTRVHGSAQMNVAPGAPARGNLHFDRVSLATLAALVRSVSADPSASGWPLLGWMEGGIAFDGPLADPARMHALVHIDTLQMRANLPAALGAPASDFTLHSIGALVFEIENGAAKVRSFHLGGTDTGVAVLGSFPCSPGKPMNLTVGGSAGLRVLELFDPNLRASGQSLIEASIRGSFSDPTVDGTLELQNGAFSFGTLPAGLTAVNGTVRFDRNRATIQKLTAESGGGELNLGGFVTFGGGPLVYNLEASARGVRVRPTANVSITANGALRLSGTSDSSILGGNISVSHIVVNANSDLGAWLASISAPAPSPGNEKDFVSGLQFDVHISSTPNLQLSSSLGRDLETDVDLRLRGTPNQPVLLGTISANQGEITVFGTKYTINRADVHFMNPVKIEPTLDLDLQTQAHGITVNIVIAGTLNRLNINYRSDPPLQPRDIIALLAVGETPGAAASAVNAPTAAQTAELQSSANTVLGQAMSPESGRLSKLFGITNIKIDPLAQGSTVTPESRLTIQQQISRNITVTYVTNLAQTSEQIFRLEWALSRQYSVVAVRDDNGEFGIDIQYKKRF